MLQAPPPAAFFHQPGEVGLEEPLCFLKRRKQVVCAGAGPAIGDALRLGRDDPASVFDVVCGQRDQLVQVPHEENTPKCTSGGGKARHGQRFLTHLSIRGGAPWHGNEGHILPLRDPLRIGGPRSPVPFHAVDSPVKNLWITAAIVPQFEA